MQFYLFQCDNSKCVIITLCYSIVNIILGFIFFSVAFILITPVFFLFLLICEKICKVRLHCYFESIPPTAEEVKFV